MQPLTIEQRLRKLESYTRSQRKRAWLDLSPKQFSNVVVNYLTLCDGAIVGDQLGLTVNSKWMRSSNFASGVDGWNIAGDGTAEFNSVTIRGTMYATAGEVGGWTISADAITGGDAILHSTGYLQLGTGNDLVRVDAADATYRLWVGHATAAQAPFRVTKAGVVTATAGTIGGWSLGPSSLYSGAAILENTGNLFLGTGNDKVTISASDATYRVWVGHGTAASAPFRVTKAGAVTATNATITGAITATSGELQSLSVSGTLALTGSGKMTWTGGKLTTDGIDFVEGTTDTRFIRWRLVSTEGAVCGRISCDWGGAGTDPVAVWLTSTIATGESPYYAITVMKAEDIDAGFDARWQLDSWGGGRVRLLTSGTERARIDQDGDIRALGGISVGSTAINPTAGDVRATADARIAGGAILGSVAYNPGVGELRVAKGIGVGAVNFAPAQGCITMSGGLWVGSNAWTPANGCLYLEGSINKSVALGCRAYRSTTQSIANTTWVSLIWNVQVHDTDGCFAPASQYLYARHAGYYMAGGSCQFASNTAGARYIAVRLNGTTYVGRGTMIPAASNPYGEPTLATGMFYMAANEYIEVQVYQSSGGSLNVSAGTAAYPHCNLGWLMRIA